MKSLYSLLAFLLCLCNTSPTENDSIIRLRQNDESLGTPGNGDWLYSHHEPGQNLKQYKSINPVTPNSKQNKIYIQPIGVFSKEQEMVIQYTANYLHIFFGLETVISTSISDIIIPNGAKRIAQYSSIQLLAPYILSNILKPRIPKDAIVIMAITEKDLYPESSWNYVFGLANLKKRIGVSSIYRYSSTSIDSINYSVCLERLIKTSSHEISHMFSLRHCTYAICVLNGSNSLSQSDSRPNRLCSRCLSKLSWNLKKDNKKRLQDLCAFFIKHGLKRDYEKTLADLYIL